MKFSFVTPSPNVELPVWEKKKAIGSCPPLGTLYIATVFCLLLGSPLAAILVLILIAAEFD